MTFTQATTLTRTGPAAHTATIDPAWAQGRGAVGGLVAALSVRALEAGAPPGLALRTITIAFTAPAAPGPASLHTELVRVGRNVATARVSIETGDTLAATALATLARPRDGAVTHHRIAMPAVPSPSDVADGPEPHYYPEFARRFFELRQCLGPLPFSGASEARVGGWARLQTSAPLDRSLLVAMLDAWPPAAVALSPGWCPVASIELTVDFVREPAGVAGWLLHDASSRLVEGGLADETATLFDESGHALATARQLIAIFPPDPASTPAPRPAPR